MTEPTRLVTGPQAREEARDAADPTELAPTETETASVRAWGLDDYEDDPPTTRLTSGRITAAAVSASLLAISAVGLMAWLHLRIEDAPAEAAVTSSMVPATMTTAAVPVAVEPPPPPPPPAVTITTVIKQVPAPTGGWVPTTAQAPPRPTWTAAHDRQFIATMLAYGWTVWDSAASTGQARDICTVLQQGGTPQSVIDELSAPGSPTTRLEAEVFVRTARETYPGCP